MPATRLLAPARRLLLAGAALAAAAPLGACARGDAREAAQATALTGGYPERGREAIRRYGCGSCHTIPGVAGADAVVGPSLAGLRGRAYVAGVLPNTPANLVTWIAHPQQVDGKTAMPELGVTAQDARDIAAYIYTLR